MDEYERAIKRVRSKKGRALKVKRSATVEPVFGTLTEFMGMRKVNTRGITNANKGMLMAATAYNPKKFLKFIKKDVRSAALSAEKHLLIIWLSYNSYWAQIGALKFNFHQAR